MKLLLNVWPPLFLRGSVGLIAALLLATAAVARGHKLTVPLASFPRLLVAAFTNVFAWMGFATLSLLWLPVGEAALLIFTMPIWVTILAWPIAGTRPTRKGVAGLTLGMAGVGILLGAQGISLGAGQLIGVGVALAAAVLFALGALLNGKPLPMAPLSSTAWQVGLGCLPMTVIGLAFEHPRFFAPTSGQLALLAYMIVLPMAICYLTWFAALKRLAPSTASTAMLLVPIVGVVSAVIILGEPLGARVILSMALTLSGVALAL